MTKDKQTGRQKTHDLANKLKPSVEIYCMLSIPAYSDNISPLTWDKLSVLCNYRGEHRVAGYEDIGQFQQHPTSSSSVK